MSKIAFIYPGQGAQKAGMGADFYEKSEIAKHIFDQAGEELDLDMKALDRIYAGSNGYHLSCDDKSCRKQRLKSRYHGRIKSWRISGNRSCRRDE